MWKYLIISFVSLLGVACTSSVSPGGAQAIRVSTNTKVKDMPVAWDSPNIYTKYDVKGNSVFMKSWTRKFDASGISFNDKRTCTLVTPQHVVMARHYKRPLKQPVVFHDRSGRWCKRYITRIADIHGDVAVGLLNEPVPAGYKVYPLLRPDPSFSNSLRGELVIITDQNRRLFVHEIAAISGEHVRFTFDEKKQIGFGKKLVSGDSGNPSFLMVNGEPVLIETHTTGGWGAGPFYGSEIIQAKLQQTIDALGGGYQLRKVSWR